MEKTFNGDVAADIVLAAIALQEESGMPGHSFYKFQRNRCAKDICAEVSSLGAGGGVQGL